MSVAFLHSKCILYTFARCAVNLARRHPLELFRLHHPDDRWGRRRWSANRPKTSAQTDMRLLHALAGRCRHQPVKAVQSDGRSDL
jgi:hypothetical protein